MSWLIWREYQIQRSGQGPSHQCISYVDRREIMNEFIMICKEGRKKESMVQRTQEADVLVMEDGMWRLEVVMPVPERSQSKPGIGVHQSTWHECDQKTPLVFARRSRRAWTYACHVINCIIRKDGSGGEGKSLPGRKLD